MKVLVVFGTRPEAIKLAPVVHELASRKNIEARVCVTAQHRSMLDQVLKIFEIKPDYDLNIMQENQSLSEISARILVKLSEIYNEFMPDWMIVQGDTSTTFVAALSGYYHKIRVAHVEAGLRTQDIYSPWPEEGNRRLTSPISALHCAPTNVAKRHLLREGHSDKNVLVTGNTVIDALLKITKRMDENDFTGQWKSRFSFIDPAKKLILVTSHRRENFGNRIQNICHALRELAARSDVQVVYPVHLNPNVQEPVNRILGSVGNVTLLEPQDYIPFVYLMKQSYMIMSDSGGVQEEAPSLGKPVLVLRDKTERIEAIDAKTALLVGTDKNKILQEATRLLDSRDAYEEMSNVKNPYGDGTSSRQIVDAILSKASAAQ